MKRGLLLTLAIVAVMLACVSGHAYAPIIGPIPDVYIGDAEDNVGSTVDLNFFRFSDAFNFDDYVSFDPNDDVTSDPADVRWSFLNLDEATDPFTINGIGSIADPTESIQPELIGKEITRWSPEATTLATFYDLKDSDPAAANTMPWDDPLDPLDAVITIYASNGSRANSRNIIVQAIDDDVDHLSLPTALIPVKHYTSPATEGWARVYGTGTDGVFINAIDGAFYIATHSSSGGQVSVAAGTGSTDARSFAGGWQSPNTDMAYVANNVYLAKFKVSTTQTNTSNVPNCRLYIDFINAAGNFAAAGGNRVGKGPFAADSAGKTYNVYVQAPDAMSAEITNVRLKFEVIDFDPAEWGTNTLQDVDVYRFEAPALGTPAKTYAPPFTGWTTLAFGSPFGNATSGSSTTGLWIETPAAVAPAPRTVDYALWQIAGASSGVAFEADKLYRSVWKLSVPTVAVEGTCARIRLIAQNQATNWSAEFVADPAAGYREMMPKVGGTSYSLWQETLPVLYGGADVALNNMGFLFDVADGRADQSGRIFLEQVDLYFYDIP